MAGAYAKLVLGTDHAQALDSADLGFLDLEVAREDGADLGEEDLLAGRHVGGAAYDLEQFSGAGIHLGDVQMVAVRVRLALHDLGDHDSGESAGDLLGLLHTVHLDADGSHRIRDLLRAEVTLQIILEPIVTELHNMFLL